MVNHCKSPFVLAHSDFKVSGRQLADFDPCLFMTNGIICVVNVDDRT